MSWDGKQHNGRYRGNTHSDMQRQNFSGLDEALEGGLGGGGVLEGRESGGGGSSYGSQPFY